MGFKFTTIRAKTLNTAPTQCINGPLITSAWVVQVTWSTPGHASCALISWEMRAPEGAVTTANLVKSKAAKHENKHLTYAGRSSSEKLY